MRRVSWPQYGDRRAFRRALALYVSAALVVVVVATLLAVLRVPQSTLYAIPAGVALLMLAALWAHDRARMVAWRSEIIRSFAGLTVVRAGKGIRLDLDDPLLGTFETRFAAARAAIDSGRWAIVVYAYHQYWVLTGEPVVTTSAAPVAFRTGAVADLVPAAPDLRSA